MGKSSPQDQKTVGRGQAVESSTPFSPSQSRNSGVPSNIGEPTSKDIRERNRARTDVVPRKSVRGEMRTGNDSDRVRILSLKKPTSSSDASPLQSVGSRQCVTRNQSGVLKRAGPEPKNSPTTTRREATCQERQRQDSITQSQSNQMEKQHFELKNSSHSVTKQEQTPPERTPQHVSRRRSAQLEKRELEVTSNKHPEAENKAASLEGQPRTTQAEERGPKLRSSRVCVTRKESASLERQPRNVTRSSSTQLEKQDPEVKSSRHPVTRKESTSLERQPRNVTKSGSTQLEKQGPELRSSRHPVTKKEATSVERQPRYVTRSQSSRLENHDSALKSNSTHSIRRNEGTVPEGGQCLTASQNTHLGKQQHVEPKDGGRSVTKSKATSLEKPCGERVAESKGSVRYVTRSKASLRGNQASSPESSRPVSTTHGSVRQRKVEDSYSECKPKEESDSVCKKSNSKPIDMLSSKPSKHSTCASTEKISSGAQHAPHLLERIPPLVPTAAPATVVPQEANVEKANLVESERPYLSICQHHDPLMEVDPTLSGSLTAVGAARLPFADFDTGSTNTVSTDALKTTPSNGATMKVKPATHIVSITVPPATSQEAHNVTSRQVNKEPVPSSESVPKMSTRFEHSQDVDEVMSVEETVAQREPLPAAVSSKERDEVMKLEKDKVGIKINHNSQPSELQKESVALEPAKPNTGEFPLSITA